MDAVERQYTEYPYPVYTDLTGRTQFGDPSVYSTLIWPEGRPKNDLRILVAGCGTVQAAMIARSNPQCRIVGLDLSETSLAHERLLQQKYALTNLTLHQCDLREARRFGSFDLIFAIGVLHHMQSPDEGLQALASVLTRQGAICLMVYAAARRYGVYLLQDALRRLGATQSPEGIALARAVMAELPVHHFARWYIDQAPDLGTDAGLVDTFLHPVDQAYTVPQVLDFVRRNGLRFQCWGDNGPYYPDGFLNPESPVYKAIAKLPDEEQWAVVEDLSLVAGQHSLIVCRPERDLKATTPPCFQGESWMKLNPVRAPFTRMIEPPAEEKMGKYRRSGAEFLLNIDEARLFDRIDGRKTVIELLSGTQDGCERSFFPMMWRAGHLHFAFASQKAEAAGLGSL
jgi:SAM-dependent methyltransferase